MAKPTTSPAQINLRTELIGFAQATLATLQRHEEWDADTNGAIGNDAIERGLAKTEGDDDKFKVLPAAAKYPTAIDRNVIVQVLAEMRQECDKRGLDFADLDRKAYQQYLETKERTAPKETQAREDPGEPGVRRRMRI